GDRLADVRRLQHRELARALLEDARDPEEVLGALGAREPGPAVLERLARGRDGEADLLICRLADLRERLLAGRVDRRVALLRLQPLPADEVAVALAELDDLPRLRRACILPPGRNGRAILLSLELSQS